MAMALSGAVVVGSGWSCTKGGATFIISAATTLPGLGLEGPPHPIGWSCTKGGGAARPRCSRDRCSATAGRLDEWSGGYCSSRVPLQNPPTSSVWFAVPWDLTILSTPAGPGSTNPSHHLAAPAAPRLGMPAWQLVKFSRFPLEIIHICKTEHGLYDSSWCSG